jgi:hypothetical protein
MNPWPFADPPNTAVITEVAVANREKPILLVTHDADDGSWQFLSGSRVSYADAYVVSLQHACSLDDSLYSLSDLPLGWMATRESQVAAWHREPKDNSSGA